jgi:riboflavin synthase
MFSGIIGGVGRILSAKPHADGLRISVEAGTLDIDDVRVGDSIAVAGCCLTVVEKRPNELSFDVSAETLGCTARLDDPRTVNLEKALRLSDRLGGHLVSGHVDGVGVIVAVEPVGDLGGSTRLVVDAPHALARFIASKGSIAVDGVSLTVNTVTGRRFAVNLIPHTLAVTTLRELAPDARVNLEIDQVARYVARLQETP